MDKVENRVEVVYVIGHKNPDTDSCVSAVALSELRSAEGMANVEAARAGDLNPQTAFIFDYLKVEPPKYLGDVYPRARDIMNTGIVHVSEQTPLQKVMELMREEGVRSVPVLDSEGRPVGVLTIMDLANRYIGGTEAGGAREVSTTMANMVETLGAEVVHDFLGPEIATLSVYVGAMQEDSFVEIISFHNPGDCIVVVGDREEIQSRAVEMGVALLVVSGGFRPSEELIELARKKGVSVAVSPHDTATTALLLRFSTPASSLCDGTVDSVLPDTLVDDLRHRLTSMSGVAVLDSDGVMQGFITKSCLLKKPRIGLILVDHNELSQAVDGAEKVEIKGVVDHHRIGNFQTTHAIPFICDPVGSTSTLVAELYRASAFEIKRATAGLLLGGVLSDTVILKSPTTTERDVSIIKWLEEKSGLEHMAFGAEIFAATSSIAKRGHFAVVNADHKVFEAGEDSFGVGQVEVIGFDELNEEKEGLLAELHRVREAKGLVLSTLLVTDIVCGTSLLLAIGTKEVIYNLGYPKLEESMFELKGVISRKKQVVPHLLSLFSSAR